MLEKQSRSKISSEESANRLKLLLSNKNQAVSTSHTTKLPYINSNSPRQRTEDLLILWCLIICCRATSHKKTSIHFFHLVSLVPLFHDLNNFLKLLARLLVFLFGFSLAVRIGQDILNRKIRYKLKLVTTLEHFILWFLDLHLLLLFFHFVFILRRWTVFNFLQFRINFHVRFDLRRKQLLVRFL